MERALTWLNLYGHEAVWHKRQNSLKTPKHHFLPVFEIMSDSLTTIWRPGIGVGVTQRHCVFKPNSNLSLDMLNHELPSLSPVSMPNGDKIVAYLVT